MLGNEVGQPADCRKSLGFYSMWIRKMWGELAHFSFPLDFSTLRTVGRQAKNGLQRDRD